MSRNRTACSVRPAAWALGVALLALAVSRGGLETASAGMIQAPILRSIAADSLGTTGKSTTALPRLRETEAVIGADGCLDVQVTLTSAVNPATPTGSDGIAVEPPAWLSTIPGCRVIGTLGSSIEVRIPPREVRALAAHPDVFHVGLCPHPAPLAQSEGLASMRVPEFWSLYHQADGVRIGVLDVGFTNYEQLLGSELPPNVTVRAFWDAGAGPDITGGGEVHGTACAEVVYDVAPGAELYLANAGTPEEMHAAVTWLIQQGVEVISHSIAWPLGGGDGTGPIQDIVALARDNGVVWVNAAGNFARGYWGGPWRDANGDRILDIDDEGRQSLFLPSVSAGRQVQLWLTWDRWPYSTDLEFEVDLVDTDGQTLIATSQTDYSTYPYAFRPLDVNSSKDLSGTMIRVRLVRGVPDGRHLRIIRTDGDLAPESQIAAGSIAVPADSPDVIAVGAYAWRDLSLEPFSSYGPTLDGRAKPDFLGPDGVQNTVFDPFLGTSAACPHVAAGVALLLGAGPRGGLFDARPSPAQVAAILRREATPLVSAVPPGSTGWGRVRLPVSNVKIAGRQLQVLGNGSAALTLRLDEAPAGSGTCEIYDLQGRLVARLDGTSKASGVIEFAASPLAARHLARGRYWAREPASGARASFLWPGAPPR